MQLFGSVINISKDKSLIARCNSVLSLENAAKLLNKPLFSDKQRKIGEIQEIFGPVNAPYLTIKPKHGLKVENFVNSHIYIGEKNEG
ncbi:TPA: hypothetical protein H1005_01155 [archaeon]|uniref:H/ACA RNA-protein complex protein Gar1 n=1 Tax=Candidatus Naiadarchaeum limnaeum TaxID=2756139 RepID=A0A832V9B8_9ARCH|nr:hypothetical protein [Candidatus Naiadarchaeales archaeon SRR2090153.bin1042]HIJ99985.1 hypothetical protein [Candidatus Naiadarchaeum limnaeum]